MTPSAALKKTEAEPILVKADPNSPAIEVRGRNAVSIKKGTIFNGHNFSDECLPIPEGDFEPGCDYAIVVDGNSVPAIVKMTSPLTAPNILGGFHFAPGGNATGTSGGDETPAINPYSVWDQNFRPACADPRGMALIENIAGKKSWVDIYLLGTEHIKDGTSKLGAIIADGNDTPQKLDGSDDTFARLDYETAAEVFKHHGKQLISLEDYFAAAYGVTEKTACGKDPKKTKLDAARTSKFGIVQASGVMWVWGTDGHPNIPRASIFGGSWRLSDRAGSRLANLGLWPVLSFDFIGARGRSDHLQLA